MAKRVALLTGGGDCPGLNAVIRAVTRRSLDRGNEVIGVRGGWRGLVDGAFEELDYRTEADNQRAFAKEANLTIYPRHATRLRNGAILLLLAAAGLAMLRRRKSRCA